MHYRQNWQGILSICRKAGKLAMGLEPTKDAVSYTHLTLPTKLEV